MTQGVERIPKTDEMIDLSARQMAKAAMAIEQIVDAYVRLKDGRALLDLRLTVRGSSSILIGCGQIQIGM